MNDCVQSFKVDANMNGDSYSSRGMAPSSTKPALKAQATDNQGSTDSGRQGSSRDYPVSRNLWLAFLSMVSELTSFSLLVMIDEAIENEAVTDDVRVPQDIEVLDHLAAMVVVM